MNRINYLSEGEPTSPDENEPDLNSLLGYKIAGEAEIRFLKAAYPKERKFE